MTFNPLMAKAVLGLREFLPPDPTVLELGSQTLTATLEGIEASDVPSLYGALGFVGYDAIDTNGRGTLDLNLNAVHKFGTRFDLVTNNGTGEHIFNQAAVFETVHNAAKPGGLMLHIVPWINWRNHAFYNFHPSLFRDLAEANGYEMLRIYAGDRNANITHETVEFDEDKTPQPTNVNVSVVCLLRKRGDDSFVYPTQKKYAKRERAMRIFPAGLSVNPGPFPHVVFPLDRELFNVLGAAWGGLDIAEDKKKKNNVLVQLNATVLREGHCGAVWKKFATYCTSADFLQEMLVPFAPYIADIYPHLAGLPLAPGVRFQDQAPFLMDCQLAFNTAVRRESTVRGFHVDDPKQLLAGLIYFSGNENGGNLQIGKWHGKRKFVGRSGMMKKAEAVGVEVVSEIATTPGTCIFFLNTPDSLHGVTPRKRTKEIRRYVNLVVEVEHPLFELK